MEPKTLYFYASPRNYRKSLKNMFDEVERRIMDSKGPESEIDLIIIKKSGVVVTMENQDRYEWRGDVDQRVIMKYLETLNYAFLKV